ncbi:MAG: hypothetical protein ACRCTR_02140 [Actinomycetota bacterium]
MMSATPQGSDAVREGLRLLDVIAKSFVVKENTSATESQATDSSIPGSDQAGPCPWCQARAALYRAYPEVTEQLEALAGPAMMLASQLATTFLARATHKSADVDEGSAYSSARDDEQPQFDSVQHPAPRP